MRKTKLIVVFLGMTTLSIWQCQFSDLARTEALHEKYCGACHLAPDPALLSKSLWRAQVLPEMGARLGIQVGDYNPLKGSGVEETYFIDLAGVYPKAPLMPQEDWQRIYDYIIATAPDSLPVDATRKSRSVPLEQFRARKVSVDQINGAQVTALHYNGPDNDWWVGNRSGEWYQWAPGDSSRLLNLFSSAISGFDQQNGEEVLLEMGYMDPSDIPKGRLWRFANGRRAVIGEGLYRPVFVEAADLDRDGRTEYLVCEFGNRIGRLLLIDDEEAGFEKKVLIGQPGIIRVRLADMNEDKIPDIVAMAGQGDEGIYILYNQGNGTFSTEHPIRLPPVYGSSWFELFDYEGDGDLDIALVNGDNADFTYALKPYHGLRLFLNDGRNEFEEAYFYPIYGATRVIVRDFDADGDPDFAVAALFPDFAGNAGESFVYLENLAPPTFTFQSYTGPINRAGHWLVMESADIDQDNDTDIVLGSYVGSPAPVPDSLHRGWIQQNVDLLILENQMGETEKEPVE